MSLRPKRQSQLEPGSTSKPPRISRIAQPIRRPTRDGSIERASSLDRLSAGTTAYSSAVKKKRSNSATPLRTPSRGFPSQGIPSTIEKVRPPVDDKQAIQIQATKITEYLRVLEPTLSLGRGGLKSMSNKQFVFIVNHFLKQIAGTRLSVGTNHVEDIVKALSQLEYPYTLNKSWLKTPTAPHAFGNVVVLLGWLQTVACTGSTINEFEEKYSQPGKEFPDKEYAQLFMTKVKEGFTLWNNSKDDEVQCLKQGLIDEIIRKRTGLRGEIEIEKDNDRLNMEFDQMVSCKAVIKNEDEFNRMDKEIKHKNKLLSKFEDICRNGEKELLRLQSLIGEKEKHLNDAQNRLAEVEQIIQTQEVSIQEQDKLISEIKFLKNLLASKKKAVCELQDLTASNQVLFSRLKNQTIQLISTFNKYLYQIFEEPADIANGVLQDFYLDRNSEDIIFDQLDKVRPLLEIRKKRNLADLNEYKQNISDLENNLKILAYEYDNVLISKLDSVSKTCASLEKENDDLSMQIVTENANSMKEVDNRLFTLKELAEIKDQIAEKIPIKEDELKKLKQQNELMMVRVTEKANEILTFKEKRIEKLDAVVNDFLITLEEVYLSLEGIIPDV